jgi:MFS family permease
VVIAFGCFALGEAALWLATIVYAFERGGVREAGAVAVVGLLFAMVVAPFAAFAGDRFRSDRALATGFACQAVTAAAAATAIWVGVPLAAYTAAVLMTGAHSLTRPVVGSMLPAVTSRPGELVRANVLIGVSNDIGVAVGPLMAAALFAWVDIGSVFVVFGVLAALGMVLTWNLDLAHTANGATTGMRRHDLADQVIGGLRALRIDRTLRAIVAAMAVGSLAIGALDVLGVVFASIRLDADGGSLAGLLAAAVGMGSIIGSLVAGRFIGRSSLMRPFLLSAVVLGVPIVALAVVNRLVPAMIFFALVGVGRSVLTVTGAVALQRLAPRNLLVRIFGVYEGLTMLAMAFGALTIPPLVERLGVGWASGVTGTAVLVIGLVAVVSVVRVDDLPRPDPAVIERLLADPLFAPLDVLAIEALAANACEMNMPAATVIVSAGDVGDHYFLILLGRLEVSVAGRVVGELAAGQSFGEIALLRDVPRQATVTAITAVGLLTVERAAFLEAVTGHPQSRTTADEVIGVHLGDR